MSDFRQIKQPDLIWITKYIMKYINYSTATGCFYTVLLMFTTAIAQTPNDVKYRITWHGGDHIGLSAAYAIIGQDGATISKSFNGELPLEIEVTAPPSATITASGASSNQDIHVLVRIYRGEQLCDATASYGAGNYATAFCSPPQTEPRTD
jgi:hypothetical protein